MKTKLLYLFTKLMVVVILIAVLAVKVLAGETPKLKLIPHSENFAIIAVGNGNDQISELTIEDTEGYAVYYSEENINKPIYSKIFDFKYLEQGSYKVSVKNKFGETSLFFNKDGDDVKVAETTVAEKPYFKLEDNILKLSLLNHSLHTVKFVLSDEHGDIFEKSLGDNFSITKGFDFKKLPKGEYSASINNGANTFSYNFEK